MKNTGFNGKINEDTLQMSIESEGIGGYPDILTVHDMQNILKIGRNTAYHLIDSGHIRHVRIGRSIRIPKTCLIDFLSSADYNHE